MKLYNLYNKTLMSVCLLLMLLFVSISATHSMDEMSIEQINKPDFLREIADTIFERVREKVRLKEKLCKHDQTMINVWKSGKKWGELDKGLQTKLTKHIPRSQVQSILRRDKHSLMSKEVFENTDEIVKNIILKGTPILKLVGQNSDRYAIEISLDISPKISGITFFKDESGIIKEVESTNIYASFEVTNIIHKLVKGNTWDKESDGEITTVCVNE